MNTAVVGLSLIESKLTSMRSCSESNYLLLLTNDVQESCREAVKILTGILDYEKLGAGLMSLERNWFNPLPFILAAVRPFSILAEEKNIIFDFESSLIPLDEREIWAVYVDEAKMSQVVRNFVSNAIKFTPSGGTIDVVTSIEHDGQDSCFRFEVIDSGPGIAAGDIGKVFNEVVQFNANAQQAGGGSGIGLWICKKIVDLHGGHVKVDSNDGSGCKFSFELPVKRKDSIARAASLRATQSLKRLQSRSQVMPSNEEPSINVQRSPTDGIATENLRILIVDDSKLNRKMMNRLMTDKGHFCTEASDGDVALQIYDQCASVSDDAFPFDVILMDNSMPVMSGRESTAALRSRGFSGVIIGVTGDALQSDISAFLASGVTAVLSKPIDVIKFDQIVKDLLRRKH